MPEKKEIFADGLESITVLEGLFRLDFFSLQSVVNVQASKDKEDKIITREENLRLILPVKGFVETLERMLKAAKELQIAESPESKDDSKNTTKIKKK